MNTLFNHILIISLIIVTNLMQQLILGLNVKLIFILLIYFNTTMYSSSYEFYIIGLKVAILGQIMLPK